MYNRDHEEDAIQQDGDELDQLAELAALELGKRPRSYEGGEGQGSKRRKRDADNISTNGGGKSVSHAATEFAVPLKGYIDYGTRDGKNTRIVPLAEFHGKVPPASMPLFFLVRDCHASTSEEVVYSSTLLEFSERKNRFVPAITFSKQRSHFLQGIPDYLPYGQIYAKQLVLQRASDNSLVKASWHVLSSYPIHSNRTENSEEKNAYKKRWGICASASTVAEPAPMAPRSSTSLFSAQRALNERDEGSDRATISATTINKKAAVLGK